MKNDIHKGNEHKPGSQTVSDNSQGSRRGLVQRIEQSRSLQEDLDVVETGIGEIDLTELIDMYKWADYAKSWLSNDKYYKGLASYCKTFRPKRVLELGTATGASTACLSLHASSVVSCDMSDCNLCDKRIFDEKVRFHQCENASDLLYLDFCSFDLIYVDIDHSGLMERLIHQKLVEDGYEGDVFYDDVRLSTEMRRFWDSVRQPKLDLDWHASGFGVVRYGSESLANKLTLCHLNIDTVER